MGLPIDECRARSDLTGRRRRIRQGPFHCRTLSQVTQRDVASIQLDGIVHYIAMEAPDALAEAILPFINDIAT
jgi:hypothetical protein